MATSKVLNYYQREFDKLPHGRARQIEWLALGLDPFTHSPVMMTWDHGQPVERVWRKSPHLVKVVWLNRNEVEFVSQKAS